MLATLVVFIGSNVANDADGLPVIQALTYGCLVALVFRQDSADWTDMRSLVAC